MNESDTAIDLLDGFIGEGYAIPYPSAIETVKLLARTEGIIPALESAHAIAWLVERVPKMSKDDLVIVNLSGRGDKDMDTYSRLL